MFRNIKRHPFDFIVLLLIGSVALSLAWFYRHFAQDDAFITYRYASNIAAGHGFVYNLGEPVLGTTTPLYTLVLAMLGKLSGQEVRLVAHLVSVISLWVGGAVLYLLGREHHRLLAAAVALTFVTNPLLISAIGMETLFLLALLLAGLQSFVAGRYRVSSILLGCLALTRYEMLIFAGILGLYYLIKHKRLPLWLIPTAVLFAGWLAAAWVLFGQVIPNSALAKLAETDGYSFATGAILWWLIYANQTALYYILLPIVLLGVYAALKDQNLPPAYWLILLWTGTYFVVAALTAGSFSWYYGPLIPGLSILLVWGLTFCLRLLTKGREIGHKPIPVKEERTGRTALFPPFQLWWVRSVWVFLVVGLVVLQYHSAIAGWTIYKNEIIDIRQVIYGDVVAWLNQDETRGKSLATEEVGVLGYYTQMQIIDLRGLVTPALIPALRRSRVETLHNALTLYSPDYLLTHESDYIEVMGELPNYKPIKKFGNDRYILYQKQTVEEMLGLKAAR